MKNSYKISDGTIIIELKRKSGAILHTKVSIAHLEKLLSMNVTWSISSDRERTYYVAANIIKDGIKTSMRLHRFITDAQYPLVVNHINGDGLDNTDENLEVVTIQVNAIKRVRMNTNNTSGVRGVSYCKDRDRWQVRFTKDQKLRHFGRFKSREEAEKVAEERFTELFEDLI